MKARPPSVTRDPAFSENSGNIDSVHPAAQLQAMQASRTDFLRDKHTDQAPEGWVFHDPLGKWINPDDASTWGKVPRNALCPCGSGKKFKHCHGKIT